MTDFTLSLHHRTFDIDNLENHVTGPVSLYNAMAVLLLGSDTKCRQELIGLLCENEDPKIFNRIKAVIESVHKDAGNSIFLNANAVYSNSGVKEDFKADAEKIFNCLVKNIPFSNDPKSCINEINKFVSDGTREKIKTIVDSNSVTEDTEIVIVNAVYFKGMWKEKFEESRTYPSKFFLMDGSEVKTDIMNSTQKVYLFQDSHTSNFSAIQMEFRDSKIRCLIAVPNYSVSFPDFLKMLKDDKEKFKSLFDIKYYSYKKTDISIPRFKISSETNMTEALQKHGLSEIFNKKGADLSKMTNQRVYVSKILHKAVFEFNEEGAEAAAATAVSVLNCSSRGPQFHVNRPFLFGLVTDDGFPIFLGHIVDPRITS